MGAIYDNFKDSLYKELVSLSPKEAKKWGARIILQEDWSEIRLAVMKEVLESKFKNELAKKLKATGDKYLEETNWWKDTFWGCDYIFGGQNHLGRILMDIRSSLQNDI